MSGPACPAWCSHAHKTPVHSRFELHAPLVGLLQSPDRARPVLVIDDVELGTDQAEPMAVLMDRVGRKDAAAAIRRLAACLDENSGELRANE